MAGNHGGKSDWMDRRSFVAKASILAAGTAVIGPLVGCAEYQIEIPCLGPAEAPVAVSGMTYIRASQIGCALDCDLRNGKNKHTGGTATDDGPRINAAMAGASADHPITLIIDGSALISGLFLPAGGYWSIAGLGCGTGFFVTSGTNNDGIHNGGPDAAIPSDPGPPAPPRGKNVSLSNFTLNGNQGTGRNGDSTTGTPKGYLTKDLWYFGINLMNLDDIQIENLVVVNVPSYHIRLSNVGSVTVTGCVFQSQGPNTDGLHFDGPATDITVAHCDFTTGDDAIALNCPEGYMGNIARVAVDNCTFKSTALMRLYTIPASGSASKYIIDAVTVSNCKGTLLQTGFWVGQGAGSLPNSVASLTLSDCHLTTPTVFEVTANFGTFVLNNVTLVPLDIYPRPGFAFLRTTTEFDGMTYVGSSLSFNNCVISRDGDLDVAAVILENNSTIVNLEFNGFRVQDPPGKSYVKAKELLNLASGSIGQLLLDTVNGANINGVVSPGGFSGVGSVGGAGVLASGWEIADAAMVDGVPFISASTHEPSIKVGGVVQPYP